MNPEDESAENWKIWGTTVNVPTAQKKFQQFFLNYKKDGQKLYPNLVDQCIENQAMNLNLDCQNVLDWDKELYQQLVWYPQTMVPVFDDIVHTYAQEFHSEALGTMEGVNRINVRPFNLRNSVAMRCLDPEHIDQLVAVSGMVMRTSSVIPDLQEAYFRCRNCRQDVTVAVSRGRIEHPQKCPNVNCQAQNTMVHIHNRSQFLNKQLVKIQETPETIPDGETPHTIDIFCFESLVDFCKPGDRVEVTGVFRVKASRVNSRQRREDTVFRTYIDSVHIKKKRAGTISADQEKQEKMEDGNENIIEFDETDETQALRRSREEEIIELGKDPNIYEKLTRSLAPSIWEMEDVKKGLLCQLFGATHKKLGAGEDAAQFRGDINVLLCGDPGTSKSQLLQYVHKVAPRGIYTSGKGSSAVGLTAYITKDPDTGDHVLESGALVLSDRGICCIDEFDKMSFSARSILHEVMEQQTISMAKAGIICRLNARTSILAAANPIESRYNPRKNVKENIDLPPTLMSRFDLIYLVLDQPNEQLDRKLAKHLISLYYSKENREQLRAEAGDIIPHDMMMEYISWSRREIHPKITEPSAALLRKEYCALRDIGRERGRKTITATPRTLESLIRLSEALARLRHSQTVDVKDVQEATRLHKVGTQQAATDPRTGRIDMGMITTGQSQEERRILEERAANIMNILEKVNARTIRKKPLLEKYQEQFNERLQLKDLIKVIGHLAQEEKVRPPRHWLVDDNPQITIL